MKGTYRVLTGIFLFCIGFTLLSIGFCAASEGDGDGTSGKEIRGGKEILVARDVINARPIWCGRSKALVYVVKGAGIFWHDIESGKKVQVTGWRSFPTACTPDGKWVIYTEFLYEDGEEATTDKTPHGTWDDDEISDVPPKTPEARSVTEVWRYEVETGRRQRFAVMFESETRGAAIDDSSPEGMKIYLGQKPVTKVKMPEPKWGIVWSLQQKSADIQVWLNDFSTAAGYYQDFDLKRRAIEIEVFSHQRKVFALYPESHDFYPLLADSKGRLFIRTQDMRAIERCDIDIDKEVISCAQVWEIEGGDERPDSCPQCPLPPISTGSHINSLALFSDDETMLFTLEGDECVRIIRIGEKEGGCFTSSRYEMGADVVISHDESWVAFTVARRVADGEIKTIQNYTDDLYMVGVKKD